MSGKRLLLPGIGAGLLLVVLLILRPLSTGRAVGIWLLVVAALVLLAFARDVRSLDTGTPRFEAALRRRKAAPAVPAELLRLERQLELGVSSAGHAHMRLVPLLRAIASARLATSHGIELGRSPETARRLIGDDVWEVLRPDRPAPPDPNAPGIPRGTLIAAIERLESL